MTISGDTILAVIGLIFAGLGVLVGIIVLLLNARHADLSKKVDKMNHELNKQAQADRDSIKASVADITEMVMKQAADSAEHRQNIAENYMTHTDCERIHKESA